MENRNDIKQDRQQGPHERNLREHCSRLKEHLIRRNIYFEEKRSGNSTVLDVKSYKRN